MIATSLQWSVAIIKRLHYFKLGYMYVYICTAADCKLIATMLL